MVAIFVAFMFVSLVLTDLGVEKWKAWRAARAARPADSAEPWRMALEALWQVPEGVHLANHTPGSNPIPPADWKLAPTL